MRTDEQVANILTNPLGNVKFLTFQERLGVVETLLIWGSIGCALATKFGGEVKAHEISNT